MSRVLVLAGLFLAGLPLLAACAEPPSSRAGEDRIPPVVTVPAPPGRDHWAERLGWPGPRSTGARGRLEVLPGRDIKADGTVLEDVWIEGQLTISADDVVVRNVHVHSDAYYAVLVTGRNVVIEDSTLRGGAHATAVLASSRGGQFVARRIDAAGAEDGIRLGNGCVLADSYVHDLRDRPGSHNDAVTADGYRGWSITGNTILNPLRRTGAVWVGDPRFGASSGVLERNLIAGGGYMIYAGPGGGGGIQVRENAFSTQYFPRGGYWGVAYEWQEGSNEWRRNIWVDGPRRGREVRPE